MNGGISQNARVLEGVFHSKLPPRNVELEAIEAWRAVDRLSTADPAQLRENIQALSEMRERLDAMFERVAL